MMRYYLYVTPFFPSPTNWRGAYCFDFVKAVMKAERGKRNGWKVLVFVPGNGADYEIDGVKVYRFPVKELPSNVLPFLFRRQNERSFLRKVREVIASLDSEHPATGALRTDCSPDRGPTARLLPDPHFAAAHRHDFDARAEHAPVTLGVEITSGRESALVQQSAPPGLRGGDCDSTLKQQSAPTGIGRLGQRASCPLQGGSQGCNVTGNPTISTRSAPTGVGVLGQRASCPLQGGSQDGDGTPSLPCAVGREGRAGVPPPAADGDGTPSLPCAVGGGEVGEWRRARAEEKVEEWLSGFDEATFGAALEKLVEEKTAAGEYRFKKPEEKKLAIEGAKRFFAEFSRKIIPLSDGRCVYFAPDARAKVRNESNAVSWAEYAFHAVSSSGKLLDGRNFRERLYNATKAKDLPLIEQIIKTEHCMFRLIDAYRENDAVIFVGQDDANGRLEVVTRLDKFGNAEANLGEVTVIATHRKKENPPPKFRPLTEVVEAVAKHQAAGFSPSTTGDSVANPPATRKGGDELELRVGERTGRSCSGGEINHELHGLKGLEDERRLRDEVEVDNGRIGLGSCRNHELHGLNELGVGEGEKVGRESSRLRNACAFTVFRRHKSACQGWTADGLSFVCHAHTANYAIYALAAKRELGAKALLHHHCAASFGLNLGVLKHSFFYNTWLFCRLRKLFEEIDCHVFISGMVKRSFLSAPNADWTVYEDYRKEMRGPRFFHCRPVRIKEGVILHNGVNCEVFGPDPQFPATGGLRTDCSPDRGPTARLLPDSGPSARLLPDPHFAATGALRTDCLPDPHFAAAHRHDFDARAEHAPVTLGVEITSGRESALVQQSAPTGLRGEDFDSTLEQRLDLKGGRGGNCDFTLEQQLAPTGVGGLGQRASCPLQGGSQDGDGTPSLPCAVGREGRAGVPPPAADGDGTPSLPCVVGREGRAGVPPPAADGDGTPSLPCVVGRLDEFGNANAKRTGRSCSGGEINHELHGLNELEEERRLRDEVDNGRIGLVSCRNHELHELNGLGVGMEVGVKSRRMDDQSGLSSNQTIKQSNTQTILIGCIGNFQDLKDQATLIRAVAEATCFVRSTDKELNIHSPTPTLNSNFFCKVIFVGSGPTLEACKSLAEEVQRKSGPVEFEFRSEVRHEELPAFYRSLDLFVLPSYFEGFGCVFTEAAACGVPFITCEGQGMDDLVGGMGGLPVTEPRKAGRAGVPPPAADGDGTPSLPGFATDSRDEIGGENRWRVDGSPWLCRPRDPEDLAKKIAYFIEHRPEQKLTGTIDINVLVERFLEDISV